VSRPGVEISLIEVAPARTPPTDTGVFFAVGPAAQGDPTQAVLVRSMAEFEQLFGARVTYSYLWDAMDCYYKEGGSTAYIARVVGPAPVAATVTLKDGGNASTLQVLANSPGAWGNNLRISVLQGSTGGTFVIQVSDNLGNILEVSRDLVDETDAINWSFASDYIDLVDVGTALSDPAVVASVALIGGTDDNTNIVEANWTTALALFTNDLGPGQVAMPGRTTPAAQANLMAHAANFNRVCLIDAVDSGSKATLKSAAMGLRGVPNARHAALFAPWAVVPGLIAGTTRTVPWSAIEAGIIAKNDAAVSPNFAAAGIQYGQALYPIALSQKKFSDADRQELNANGVNIAVQQFGGIMAYGYRTLTDPNLDPNWIQFTNSRLYMAIVAQADAIGENYVFSQIDGKGVTLGKFNGDLTAMLLNFYNEGSLYGGTSDQAFTVDTGPSVNTPQTIAAGEIHAVLRVKMSPFAELVVIEIVKRLITDIL
jgi:phage tail sheath protein FI